MEFPDISNADVSFQGVDMAVAFANLKAQCDPELFKILDSWLRDESELARRLPTGITSADQLQDVVTMALMVDLMDQSSDHPGKFDITMTGMMMFLFGSYYERAMQEQADGD